MLWNIVLEMDTNGKYIQWCVSLVIYHELRCVTSSQRHSTAIVMANVQIWIYKRTLWWLSLTLLICNSHPLTSSTIILNLSPSTSHTLGFKQTLCHLTISTSKTCYLLRYEDHAKYKCRDGGGFRIVHQYDETTRSERRGAKWASG